MFGLTSDQSLIAGAVVYRTLASLGNALPRPGVPFKLYQFFYTFVQQELSNLGVVASVRFPEFNAMCSTATTEKG